MALKALVTAEEFKKLPEPIQKEYKQEGDDFILDVSDKDYKDRIHQFRQNNTDLMDAQKSLNEKLKTFDGMNPETYKDLEALRDRINGMEEAELIKAGKLDEVVARRNAKLTDEHAKELQKRDDVANKLATRAKEQANTIARLKIQTDIIGTLSKKAAVRPEALPDVAARASQSWKLDENDQLTPIGADGKPVYSKDGKTPISPDEWATELITGAPHLFASGGGGGASGGAGGGGSLTGNVLRLKHGEPLPSQHLDAIGKGTMQVQRTD